MHLSFQQNLPSEKKQLEWRLLLSFVLVSIFCLLSIRYIDGPLSQWMAHLSHSQFKAGYVEYFNLFLFLTSLVYFIALLMMIIFVVFRFFGAHIKFVDACGMLSVSIAISFFVKTEVQSFFGRVAPCNVMPPGFEDFHLMESGCFPSGHMTVFSCLLILTSFYYPRLKWLCYGLLGVLGVFLILEGYHFLSDVVAGTFLGVVIAIVMRHGFKINLSQKK